MTGRTRLGAGLAVLSLGVLAWAGDAVGQPLWPDPLALARPSLVVPAERHAVSGNLRDTPAIGPPETPEFRVIPRPLLQRWLSNYRHKKGIGDPALQSFLGGLDMPAPAGSFGGLGNINGAIPPDTNGAVGPNHYVQWVNVSFAIYDKATGARVYGPAAGNTLWQALGGPCAVRNDGDPVVLYDQLAGRWVMSQFALPNYPSGPFYQCIAVSKSSDPTGAFSLYAFKISDTKMNDYPKLGVWPDAYYMTANQFTCGLSSCNKWAGQGVVAFERDKMLAGLPARMVYFDLLSVDANLGGMLPSDVDGPAPPAGTPNYFAEFDDNAWGYSPDQVQIWAFHVDWATPANSTFTKVAALQTQAFDSNLCNYSVCVPQPGTTSKLDTLSDRFMYRMQYRNFGAYATLVANHTVDVDNTNHAGIRWYELRNAGSGWSIYQQGTYAPDGDHRWMGSIAMDQAGNIALGYSVSGTATYPSVRYTGRLATDPLGTLPQGEASFVEGTGSQLSTTGRWGDYSLMAVDPTDDCTFWYTQEYYGSTTNAAWRTWIGSFKFPSCGSTSGANGADLALTNSGSPNPVLVGGNLTYSLMVTNNGPDSATNVTLSDTLPGTVTLKSVSSPQMSCVNGSTVTCTLGTLPSGLQASATIVVTPTVTGTISNSATVSSSQTDPQLSNNSATAVTTVTAPAPVVSACTPASGSRGTTLTVAVTGANFKAGATAKFGLGVSVLSVTFVSSAKLNVQVKIPWWISPGSRTVTVTNPNGTSGSKAGCFTVN